MYKTVWATVFAMLMSAPALADTAYTFCAEAKDAAADQETWTEPEIYKVKYSFGPVDLGRDAAAAGAAYKIGSLKHKTVSISEYNSDRCGDADRLDIDARRLEEADLNALLSGDPVKLGAVIVGVPVGAAEFTVEVIAEPEKGVETVARGGKKAAADVSREGKKAVDNVVREGTKVLCGIFGCSKSSGGGGGGGSTANQPRVGTEVLK